MQLGFVVSNATEKMEIAVCNEPGSDQNIIKVRTTHQGAWSPWMRIDVHRKGNDDHGELDAVVYEASVAKTAKTAQAAQSLASPVTITFTGDISGSFSFDGLDPSVQCKISGVQSAINTAIADHVKKYHSYSPGDEY